MADEVVMGLWGSKDIRIVVATAISVSRTARDAHKARPAAAALLAEALTASALLSAIQLQKENSDARINLQLECDGALRGLFVESDGQGHLRGYVKNPFVEVVGDESAWRWRPALGNNGFISVLRERKDGEYFRSSVQLEAFDLPRDFERYFTVSEQLETGIAIEVLPAQDEFLGSVAGVLLQTLPGGNVSELRALRDRLQSGGLKDALAKAGNDAKALLDAVLPDPAFEVTARYPLAWRCPCSKERVTRALLTLGAAELEDMLQKDGKAETSCQFCNAHYVVSADELKSLIAQVNNKK